MRTSSEADSRRRSDLLLRIARIALRAGAAITVGGMLLGPAAAVSLASLTGQAASSGALASWTWKFYLHNDPTPPTGNTAAQANLSMDGSAPTGVVGYVYDANLDTQIGRRINRSGAGPGETDLHLYQNWRSPSFPRTHTLNGTATLGLWSGISAFRKAKAGSIVAYLRDFNPDTGAYVEIANATLNQSDWQSGSGTWVFKEIGIAVSAYTLASGHQLELKLETTSFAAFDMLTMYDTVGQPSTLKIP